ncbi:hypothetical protein Tco_0999646, partial [Tanacetum coccineum]
SEIQHKSKHGDLCPHGFDQFLVNNGTVPFAEYISLSPSAKTPNPELTDAFGDTNVVHLAHSRINIASHQVAMSVEGNKETGTIDTWVPGDSVNVYVVGHTSSKANALSKRQCLRHVDNVESSYLSSRIPYIRRDSSRHTNSSKRQPDRPGLVLQCGVSSVPENADNIAEVECAINKSSEKQSVRNRGDNVQSSFSSSCAASASIIPAATLIVYVDHQLAQVVYNNVILNRIMATRSSPDISCEMKGKMIMMEPKIMSVADFSPTHYSETIEAIVYRKWTSKPPEQDKQQSISVGFAYMLDFDSLGFNVKVYDILWLNKIDVKEVAVLPLNQNGNPNLSVSASQRGARKIEDILLSDT